MINLDESISKILNNRVSRQISTDIGMGIDLDKLMFLKSLQQQEIPYKSPLDLMKIWTTKKFQNHSYNSSFSLQSKSLYSKQSLPLLKETELIYLKIKNSKEMLSSSKVSSILASQNHIFLGYSSGKVWVFSHSCRPIQELKVNKQEDAVISLELYSNESILVASHSSGLINLFDLSRFVWLSSLTIHFSPVTCLKYWNNSEDFLFSGDSSGKCFLSQFDKTSLKGKVSSFNLVNGEVGPVSCIEVSARLTKCKYSSLVAICGLKRVAVYSIEPVIEVVYVLEMQEEPTLGFFPSCVWLQHSFHTFLMIVWETSLFVYEYVEEASCVFTEKTSIDLQAGLVKILTFETKAVIVLAKEEIFCFKIEKLVRLEGKILRKMKVAKIDYQEVVKVDSLARPTYENMISFCSKGIFFISGVSVFKLTYLNWNSCLDELKEKKNWMCCLSLAIQFLKGKYQRVYSLDEANLVSDKVSKLLLEYSSETSIPLKYRIWNSIEICIILNDFDQLNVEIYEKLVTEGKEKAVEGFIQSFEFFVMTGQLKSLSIIILARMADYYKEHGKLNTFESILVHLNPLWLNQKAVKGLCQDLNMTTGYIFISSSSITVNFFEIFQALIENLKLRNDLNEKMLIFYQMFYFMNKLLNKKMIDDSVISDQKHLDGISAMLGFFSNLENLDIFMELDPSSTLDLLFLIHTTEESQSLMENSEILISSLSDTIKMLLDHYPETNQHYLQICLFIVSVSCKKGQIIDKDIQYFIVKYLLLHDSVLRNNQIFAFDINDYISQISQTNKKPLFGSYGLEEFDKTITKSIKRYSFNEDQQQQIFKLSSFLPYSRLIIYASESRSYYDNCIFTFIRCPSPETRLKVFKWIRKIYNSLENTQEFLTIIENFLEDLGILDAKSCYSLILDFFSKNFLEIVKKLKRAETLQFMMLEKVKKKGIPEDLLEIYIKLLSKFKPEEVLPFLRTLPASTPMDILDTVTEICKAFKKIDAVCFLLSLQNKIFQALEIIYLELRSNIKNLSEITSTEIDSIKDHVFKIYEICEGNLDDLKHHEAKGIFTSILEVLIQVYEKLKGKFEEVFRDIMKMFVTAALHYVNFEFLLQKTAEITKNLPMSIFKEALFELLTKRSVYLKNLRIFSNVLQEELKVKTKKQVLMFKKGLNAQSICWGCMSSLQSKQKVKIFQCRHGFHEKCLGLDECSKCLLKKN